MKEKHGDTFKQTEDIASFTECTGLMAIMPDDEAEDKTLAELYGIHSAQKHRKKNDGK